MRFYAGIGSRQTPVGGLDDMREIAHELEIRGYTLRSGNADGADAAFASGVEKNAQIWLPYKNFNINYQILRPDHTYKLVVSYDREALLSVKEFHPAPERLGTNGLLFMARNFRQIVGRDEANSEFVICWTPEGKEKGGTAQAMRIARHYKIPIYNLFNLTSNQIFSEINKLDMLS